MTEISEAILEKKLTELRDSQKEIQSLSQYCVHHRQHCKLIVKVELQSPAWKLHYDCSELTNILGLV